MGIIGLVGGASGRELTEEIQKQGYEVLLICGQENEHGSEIAEHVLVTDLGNHEVVYQHFKELNCEHLIIGTGHRFAFNLGESLASRGILLNVNIEASKLAKEKRAFKDFISARGFKTPAYVSIPDKTEQIDVEEIVNTVGLPCVVKATIDTMLPQKANNIIELKQEMDAVFDSGSPVIIEQFVKGIDLTVFVSSSQGVVKALPVCYYSKAEDNDMRGFTDNEYLKEHLSSELERQVMRYCEDLVRACGFEGLPRIDLMVLPNGDSFILEANSVCVTGLNERHAAYCKGTVLALREKGLNVAEIAVDAALNTFNLL